MTQHTLYTEFRCKVLRWPFKVIFEDVLGKKVKALSLLIQANVLATLLNDKLPQKTIGLSLPNTATFPIVFMALQSLGKTTAILNYAAGLSTLKRAVRTAQIQVVITSRLFEEKAKLQEAHANFKQDGIQLIYLEDLIKDLKVSTKLKGLLRVFSKPKASAQDPAVILFTSGSEGAPKAVLLSHTNIIENARQVTQRVPFHSQDILFSSLPFFHAFGLLAGVILPLFYGLKSYIYPTPLDYKTIPIKIAEVNATILFSANTFLRGYAMAAPPHLMESLTAIYAGAEKLHEETRELYLEKFKVPIYQGYGVTEASPVIAVNVKEEHTPGSVGRPLSEIEIKLAPFEGYEDGGRLCVKGPNVMLGYYLAENPGVLVPPHEGWHDTGDIAHIDENGYLYILGRAKRFAKIGGEMVSLAATEYAISQKWPEGHHAALSRHHPKKGEEIVIVTDSNSLTLGMLKDHLACLGFSNLSIPKTLIFQESLPLLPTGKIDYVNLQGTVTDLGETSNVPSLQ